MCPGTAVLRNSRIRKDGVMKKVERWSLAVFIAGMFVLMLEPTVKTGTVAKYPVFTFLGWACIMGGFLAIIVSDMRRGRG